jgi:tetratricopeptide (TPR) repeat protein
MNSAIRLSTVLAAVTLLAIALTPELQAVQSADDAIVKSQATDQDAKIQDLIDKGDALGAAGKWGTARRYYSLAADLKRKQGQLPGAALRRIANSYYYQDRFQSAGKILEQLAKEAAAYGELRCQAWALADAAWIAWIAGDKIDMERRLVRLDRLLMSPYLPDDVRDDVIEKRLAGVTTAQTLAAIPK